MCRARACGRGDGGGVLLLPALGVLLTPRGARRMTSMVPTRFLPSPESRFLMAFFFLAFPTKTARRVCDRPLPHRPRLREIAFPRLCHPCPCGTARAAAAAAACSCLQFPERLRGSFLGFHKGLQQVQTPRLVSASALHTHGRGAEHVTCWWLCLVGQGKQAGAPAPLLLQNFRLPAGQPDLQSCVPAGAYRIGALFT